MKTFIVLFIQFNIFISSEHIWLEKVKWTLWEEKQDDKKIAEQGICLVLV